MQNNIGDIFYLIRGKVPIIKWPRKEIERYLKIIQDNKVYEHIKSLFKQQPKRKDMQEATIDLLISAIHDLIATSKSKNPAPFKETVKVARKIIDNIYKNDMVYRAPN